MATVSVSNASQLQDALDSAERGDKIVLAAGNYGTLSLNGNSKKADYKFDNITITSKSGSNAAVFNRVELSNVTNVTFDNIKFDYRSGDGKPFAFRKTEGISIIDSEFVGKISSGYGAGHGLWVMNSSDFRIEGSEIRDFATGTYFNAVDNLKILDNSYSGVSRDGMQLAGIDGVLIEGNQVEMKGEKGLAHRDLIQFWNSGTNDPSEDVTIRGNTLVAAETVTHGIYMGNDVARNGGGIDSFYKNVVIENNIIKSGQILGILVGETDDVIIRYNTVLQHTAIDSTRAVDIPVIRVEDSSRDVTIVGNTTHRAPEAAASTNWQPSISKLAANWTISGNKIVALGTDVSTGSSSGSSGGDSGGSVAEPVAPVAPSAPHGDGTADDFRFNGTQIDGSANVTFRNVDFGEGDRIVLQNFDECTFLDFGGGSGNKVVNNADKTYVRIDSLTDIQEIVTASKDLSVSFKSKNDVLMLKIAQDDGTLNISLPSLADAYKSTFDDSVF